MANNYIVRIYRYEKNKPHHSRLVGVVEDVEVDGQQGFSNIEELWKLLTAAENREGKRWIAEAEGR